jgi:hypothetical protein
MNRLLLVFEVPMRDTKDSAQEECMRMNEEKQYIDPLRAYAVKKIVMLESFGGCGLCKME